MTDAGRRDWIEIGAAVLLALAAVATAWSSYQAARWNGEQAKTASAVSKTRIEAARASDLANAQQQVDVQTFSQWVATRPLETDGAPLTPFVLPQYRLAAKAEANRLDRKDEVLAAQMRRNVQRSTNYVLGVVLFAVALFFAGISTKLTTQGPRKALLFFGCIVFLGALAWVATSPVSLSV